jgi:uncharacterized protein YcbX
MEPTVSDLSCTLQAIYLHPVKSCAGVSVDQALLIETGLEFDRAWMLVDENDRFISQRECPVLALVEVKLQSNDLRLRAPGMLALHVALDRVEAPRRVTVWNDRVAAYDMGALAAQWFSDYLGQPVRLVRFDPQQRRRCDARWCGQIEAQTALADAFALLITSTASLAELNRRLVQRGHAAVEMRRFRPNLVLDGLDAHDEDHVRDLHIDTAQGPVHLRLVKPCTRCSIPDVDPTSGLQGSGVLEALASYRSDPRVDGGVTFGMNAVVVSGVEHVLAVGQGGRASLGF